MPVDKVCQQCNKGFQVPFRRHEAVKFCSRDCKAAAGWQTHQCEACGTEFKRKKGDNPTSQRKYCSLTCNRQSIKGRKHQENPDKVRHYRTCETCSKEFEVTAQRKDTARFCSKECKFGNQEYRQQMGDVQKADKHWRWTGGRYKRGCGYIKVGSGSMQTEHRKVIYDAMIAQEPNHPFLIDVNGNKVLDPRIEVHHIDRDRGNNELCNLLAVTKHAHLQIHHRNKRPEPWECWPSHPERW